MNTRIYRVNIKKYPFPVTSVDTPPHSSPPLDVFAEIDLAPPLFSCSTLRRVLPRARNAPAGEWEWDTPNHSLPLNACGVSVRRVRSLDHSAKVTLFVYYQKSSYYTIGSIQLMIVVFSSKLLLPPLLLLRYLQQQQYY